MMQDVFGKVLVFAGIAAVGAIIYRSGMTCGAKIQLSADNSRLEMFKESVKVLIDDEEQKEE